MKEKDKYVLLENTSDDDDELSMDTSENPRKPTKNHIESEEESDEDGKYFHFRNPIEVARELFQLAMRFGAGTGESRSISRFKCGPS